MKRSTAVLITALVFVFFAGSAALQAQSTFKIPFKFESGGKKFPAGEYWVGIKGEGQITFRQESNGAEIQVPFVQKLGKPQPPLEGPQLVFDEVGNFEPSYTEYFTVYVLAEVWLSGTDGYLIHMTKGAHKTQVVKGAAAKK